MLCVLAEAARSAAARARARLPRRHVRPSRSGEATSCAAQLTQEFGNLRLSVVKMAEIALAVAVREQRVAAWGVKHRAV
eukprot:6197703-Pleurochrysis_carterae.AAC.4